MQAAPIQGQCDTRFATVRDAFAANFSKGLEQGAALAVYHHGKLVIDLWGGFRDAAGREPWQSGTMACMMSVAKGMTTLCMGILHERGQLDLDARVVKYWPEFGQAGKDAVTVRQALGHLAGIPVLDTAQEGDFYDWQKMIHAIERQAPLWPPGTNQVYHSSTLGHIAGEILRRITGKSLGRFLRDEVSEKIGADYFIGLTPAEQARCAAMIPSPRNVVTAAKLGDQTTIAGRMWRPLPKDEDFNSTAWRASEIPSVNGHGTAKGVARIYGAVSNGGSIDGVRVIDADGLAPFLVVPEKSGKSEGSGLTLRMGLGFMLNSPPHRYMGSSMRAFGHSGAGGAQSFADPDNAIGFCYAPNRMHDGSDMDPRAHSLIEATYACL